MPIDEHSPLWAVLADWVKILLTLPDPPPEQLVQLNDVAIITAISALTERLSAQAVLRQMSLIWTGKDVGDAGLRQKQAPPIRGSVAC